MRLLLLGSSGELIGKDQPGGTTLDRICAGIERRTGLTVEGHFAFASPTATLGRHLDGVLNEFDADVVLLHTVPRLATELSLDLGLRRRFGGHIPSPIRFVRDLARRGTAYDSQIGVDRQRSGRPSLYGA